MRTLKAWVTLDYAKCFLPGYAVYTGRRKLKTNHRKTDTKNDACTKVSLLYFQWSS